MRKKIFEKTYKIYGYNNAKKEKIRKFVNLMTIICCNLHNF